MNKRWWPDCTKILKMSCFFLSVWGGLSINFLKKCKLASPLGPLKRSSGKEERTGSTGRWGVCVQQHWSGARLGLQLPPLLTLMLNACIWERLLLILAFLSLRSSDLSCLFSSSISQLTEVEHGTLFQILIFGFFEESAIFRGHYRVRNVNNPYCGETNKRQGFNPSQQAPLKRLSAHPSQTVQDLDSTARVALNLFKNKSTFEVNILGWIMTNVTSKGALTGTGIPDVHLKKRVHCPHLFCIY